MKVIRKIIPPVIILLFVGIMTTTTMLKEPLSHDDDVLQLLSETQDYILNDNFTDGLNSLERTQVAWQHTIKRIQYSSQREEINGLTMALSRAKGAILVSDKSNAIVELLAAQQLFNQLGH